VNKLNITIVHVFILGGMLVDSQNNEVQVMLLAK